ncbi:hypothetical protein Tco_0713272, partial [Tanacetum coccineum]
MESAPTKTYLRIMLPTFEDLLRSVRFVDCGLAAETEVTKPKLPAVVMNFESKYRQDDDFAGPNPRKIAAGSKRGFGDIDDDEDDLFGSKK